MLPLVCSRSAVVIACRSERRTFSPSLHSGRGGAACIHCRPAITRIDATANVSIRRRGPVSTKTRNVVPTKAAEPRLHRAGPSHCPDDLKRTNRIHASGPLLRQCAGEPPTPRRISHRPGAGASAPTGGAAEAQIATIGVAVGQKATGQRDSDPKAMHASKQA